MVGVSRGVTATPKPHPSGRDLVVNGGRVSDPGYTEVCYEMRPYNPYTNRLLLARALGVGVWPRVGLGTPYAGAQVLHAPASPH